MRVIFGGSSHVIQVADSGNNGCLDAQSARTTANSLSEGLTAIGGSTTTFSSPSATVTLKSGEISPAAVGGAVVGGLVALLILGTLSIFFFRTYLLKKTHRPSHYYNANDKRRSFIPPADLPQPSSADKMVSTRQALQNTLPSQWTTFSPAFENNHDVTSYAVLDGAVGVHITSATKSGQTVHTPMGEGAITVPRSSKSPYGLAAQRPTHFVLHIDAEDEIELPPQYTDCRSGHSIPNLTS